MLFSVTSVHPSHGSPNNGRTMHIKRHYSVLDTKNYDVMQGFDSSAH